MMFGENINIWPFLGLGLTNWILGIVLIITGTEKFTSLKREFKFVLLILDSLILWLKGKTGRDDFLFDPAIGI